MARYIARCPRCNSTRTVNVENIVEAAPVYCPCGAHMGLSASDLAVPTNTPQASVSEVASPAIERLTDKGLPIYISAGRQEAFEKLMRKAFPTGIPGMESI